MDRALPEMLHCTDMSVLGRQRGGLKWQQEQFHLQQQQHESYFSELSGVFQVQQQGFQDAAAFLGACDSLLVKADPGLENWWSELGKVEVPGRLGFGPCGYGNGPSFEMNYAISRTSSCPPAVLEAAGEAEAVAVKGRESTLTEKISSGVARESFKKRKADKVNNTKVVGEDDTRNKKNKGCAEEGESKITHQNNTKSNNSNTNRETSADTSKENSKVSEVQKPDYIHVRARRGQATDSHSLAERVRREKISERMKYLQDLVPGCNKITGKAGMLDEIINYVQSLQRQVEFLSMKLAAVNPRLDFNIDNLLTKEPFPSCVANIPTIGMTSDVTNHAYLQFNPLQEQVVSCCGLEMGQNPPDMGLRRTISAPVSIPETFLDSSCFTQILPSPTWDTDLQNLYNVAFDQGRSSSAFPSQPFTGSLGATNLKMEM